MTKLEKAKQGFMDLAIFATDRWLMAWKMRKFWQEPAKGFVRARSASFQLYDRNLGRFRYRLSWRRRWLRHSYFLVYFDKKDRIIGHKLMIKGLFWHYPTYVERIYQAREWERLFAKQDDDNDYYTPYPEDDAFYQGSAFAKDVGTFLWEVRVRFSAENLKGKSKFFYQHEGRIVEYLEKPNIKGLVVSGENIIKERSRISNHYVKKYRDVEGRYLGFDEFYKRKKRNRLRLYYNEDGVMFMSRHWASTRNKRELQEVSQYDRDGRKESSELYEGELLQKSARFVYNEDSKLVNIIQYDPHGNPLND